MKLKAGPLGATEKNIDKTRVLSRSYDILMAINSHPDGLTLRELCTYTKLARSTIQRILATLEEQNIVMASPTTGLYRLGPTLTLLAANVRPFDITQMARPILMQLANATEESVYLCVLAHGKAVVVDLVRGSHPLATLTTLGTSLPLHATACGKALLAMLPPEDLETLRPQLVLSPCTPGTPLTWEALEADLSRIRHTGVALDFEEHQPGTSAIAVPLKGLGKEIATISIPMPTERFRECEQRLTDIVLRQVQQVR
nr:IclR family transcriptional regulator [uncultured Holophaga sp.]